MCSKEAQEIAKAVAMATANGFESGLAGCSYIAYVGTESTAENTQSSPVDDDDLYIAVYRAEKASGWVVACNSLQPARLFSTENKAMAFYYRLLNEIDELKLSTYEEDYTPLEDNEAVYKYITRGALL